MHPCFAGESSAASQLIAHRPEQGQENSSGPGLWIRKIQGRCGNWLCQVSSQRSTQKMSLSYRQFTPFDWLSAAARHTNMFLMMYYIYSAVQILRRLAEFVLRYFIKCSLIKLYTYNLGDGFVDIRSNYHILIKCRVFVF